MSPLTVIGIDASNLRLGGGRSHLIELLRAAQPSESGIDRVIVWASVSTLDLLKDQPWLIKKSPTHLNKGLFYRSFWQRFILADEAAREGCELLFIPGGNHMSNYHPVVTMSQNLLPFESREMYRYRLSIDFLKLLLLRWIQTWSFRHSEGVIFLTNYARQAVEKITGSLPGLVTAIPHGLSSRFYCTPRNQFPISCYTVDRPFRIVYVSAVAEYKHQWTVVEAISQLRSRTGWPIQLILVGPAYPSALKKLKYSLNHFDPRGEWAQYDGSVSYQHIHNTYVNAELAIWASTCENLPISLLEAMASGLPIASSSYGPMPEVLGSSGVYFDPENSYEIAEKVEQLVRDPDLRLRKAESSFHLAQAYSWSACADQTFSFLARTLLSYQHRKKLNR